MGSALRHALEPVKMLIRSWKRTSVLASLKWGGGGKIKRNARGGRKENKGHAR